MAQVSFAAIDELASGEEILTSTIRNSYQLVLDQAGESKSLIETRGRQP
jgi:hypothetical protein